MNDLVCFLYYGVLSYFCIKGFGYLIGIGIKKRNKCWSSEEYLKRKWKRTNDLRYKEYFK